LVYQPASGGLFCALITFKHTEETATPAVFLLSYQGANTMTIHSAEQLSVSPLACGDCLMSNNGRPCHPVVRAIVKAAVALNPTVDIPSQAVEKTAMAQILTNSLAYQAVALPAGEAACKAVQGLYNRTAAESPLTVMT
jgi:hypothetical protein